MEFHRPKIFDGLKTFRIRQLPHDLLSGFIIALVSIPISMGYAQIAGLPPVYGLYGSILPVLVFSFLTSSPQFIFGVDAAPCALVGAELSALGIAAGSQEAVSAVPLFAFFTGIFLVVFAVFRAGKLKKYVSTPVMGGFVSGICITIIFMQIPKLFGGQAGTGEIIQLLTHLVRESKRAFNPVALGTGITSILLILLCRKFFPKFPLSVCIMLFSALMEWKWHFFSRYSINLLPEVQGGFPGLHLPDFSAVPFFDCIKAGFSIAIVVTAETLLAANSYAQKDGYKLSDNTEILAYGTANIAACLMGTCPVNGSVSRTSMNHQFRGVSQVTEIVSGLILLLILCFGTGFIKFLPVPVLTAIVITALWGAVELPLARKLHQLDRQEFAIFLAALLAVLLLGTIYGVFIGVILSMFHVVIKESVPPRAFLGCIPGRGGFFELETNPAARPLKDVIIYRFRGNLFFADIEQFKIDLDEAVSPSTKAVIVDASGISTIDITASETLEIIWKSFQKKGIKFYLTEHAASLNEQLRKIGLGEIIEKGGVRRKISVALHDLGMKKPYELETADGEENPEEPVFREHLLREFEWAFGKDADIQINAYVQNMIEHLNPNEKDDIEGLVQNSGIWKGISSYDEELILQMFELRICELEMEKGNNDSELLEQIEERRNKILEEIRQEDEKTYSHLEKNRIKLENRLKERNTRAVSRIERISSWGKSLLPHRK